ncbi:sialidase family protein [Chryseosolibacter indicus]|uniref:Glycoside hydrolase n=1 Tax=Chryseosolibacter indicus TaxID=2782351 RepID=A0ABS5VM37_9BACT|nr:sialidase family protein [Chryseosolibacter indicus]MBT1702522.1 glycoside hydrolase [Chryseosolibacter indicus]
MKLLTLLVTSITLIITSTSLAQFKNIRLDEQSQETEHVNQPCIAINPRNTLNVVAASNSGSVYATKDGGVNWQKINVTSSSGSYGDPAIVCDLKGTFYFFHLSGDTTKAHIVIHESSDGGITWSPGESIGLDESKSQRKARPVVDSKGNITIAWTQFDKYGDQGTDCHSNVLLSRSKNGKKWSLPVTLSQTEGNCLDDSNANTGAFPAISMEGKMYVVWTNKGKMYLDRSYDGGNMWLSNDVFVGDQIGGSNMNIPGHKRCNSLPVFLSNNSKTNALGQLYLLWADQRNGADNTDIWFMRSANGGDNWTIPTKVNNDNTKRHQYVPWMAVDQASGYVYVMFYDRRDYEDERTDVYIAYSTDGGSTFKNVKVSESPFIPSTKVSIGDYNSISAHKGVIAPVWTRIDNGVTSVWTSIISHEDLVKAK